MDGTTEVLKDAMGRQTEVSERKPGDYDNDADQGQQP
jgi:hypothetical protein